MKATITIDGIQYPCRPTLGALRIFKEISGREISQIGTDEISEHAIYLYCCARSASRREGIAFPLSLDDFLDALDVEDLTRWTASIAENRAEDEPQKKTQP